MQARIADTLRKEDRPGLRSFAAVGELYELNPCGGWVPVPRAQNSSSRWVGAPATLLKPLVATERLR